MNVSLSTLTALLEELFIAADLPAADARLCAEVFLLQEMRGVITHGLRHVSRNLEHLKEGRINPRPRRVVLRDEAATVVLDGDSGIGIAGCMDAMGRSIEKAKQFGIGIAIVIHSNHFLSAAPYCLRAVEQGLVGICLSNTWASMGYPGAKKRSIGNAPIGFGVPGSDGVPLIFDAALTTSAGALQRWIADGAMIPRELMGLDSTGHFSSDPSAVLFGGTPWPIGGHKGAGLAIMVEILTGLLGGSGFLHSIQPPHLRVSQQNSESQCCIAIDISKFMPLSEFLKRMATFAADLKGSPCDPCLGEILLPGERAYHAHSDSSRHGIPVEEDVEAELRSWAKQLGVTVSF